MFWINYDDFVNLFHYTAVALYQEYKGYAVAKLNAVEK